MENESNTVLGETTEMEKESGSVLSITTKMEKESCSVLSKTTKMKTELSTVVHQTSDISQKSRLSEANVCVNTALAAAKWVRKSKSDSAKSNSPPATNQRRFSTSACVPTALASARMRSEARQKSVGQSNNTINNSPRTRSNSVPQMSMNSDGTGSTPVMNWRSKASLARRRSSCSSNLETAASELTNEDGQVSKAERNMRSGTILALSAMKWRLKSKMNKQPPISMVEEEEIPPEPKMANSILNCGFSTDFESALQSLRVTT